MEKLLSKLGITPISKGFNPNKDDPVISVFKNDVEELEQQRNELLETLIDISIEQEHIIRREHLAMNCVYSIRVKGRIKLIEKIAGKQWKEIQELNDAD